jgi:predicted transcriptional regulator
MLTVELDPAQQQRLDQLAATQGEDGATLARRILLDYLDFQSLPNDTDEQWAEASVAMTPEVMEPEDWDE